MNGLARPLMHGFIQRRQLLRWSIIAASLPLATAVPTFAQPTSRVDRVRALAFLLIPDHDAPAEIYDAVASDFATDYADDLDSLLALFPEIPQTLPAEHAERLLAALGGHPHLAELRRRTATAIYTSPEVWNRIGYGGSSLEFGGYLGNGFDDIDWLPETAP